MPLSLIVLSFVFSLVLRKSKLKKLFRMTALAMLFLFSNQFVANEILLLWETPATAIDKLEKGYDIGIVLCGITKDNKSPNDRVYFNKGADRILHPIRLYKQGIIKKILISGGSSRILLKTTSEASRLYQTCLTMGVPDQDIILEDQSRNTWENALFSTRMILRHYPGAKCLLVTSAFHMRRAALCFKKAGLNPTTFSADFHTHDREFAIDQLLVPSPAAITKWTILFKELIGIASYKAVGYI